MSEKGALPVRGFAPRKDARGVIYGDGLLERKELTFHTGNSMFL